MIRRCPQCGTATDDMYGFCIKCGHEFPKIESDADRCPLCGYNNPEEADYCVKCGTPLVFKQKFPGDPDSNLNPIVIKKEISDNAQNYRKPKTSKWLIIFGYIFSILGGLLGLIVAIYLSTRKDPVAKKHGHIQLSIFLFYLLVIIILIATRQIPSDILTQYKQLLAGNFTSI